ncbi:low molecular weight phosphotyrosine protein phosphatase [Cupriavidus taiwanensis]|uniref:low molecular weight protein-tyrosine-phosphatase n=1 Tax=Cupriavidus taiwanensis TaxID=164546 RepID=UPI001572CF74|nr:low molecular weight protein-tyrosine-phosphatase [Cupriavidus taiwanensis]NSX16267.1 low molecular weight phosphotyrosine protein phosphatase [Cupriavidus taiwanensis]
MLLAPPLITDEAAMIRSILVVCLGNRCRSPMAADLLRQALPDCSISSAGLAPPPDAGADPRVIRLLAKDGLDLAAHRTRELDDGMVNDADLVLVMDSEQREWLEQRFPQARGKTFRLCEAAQADIPDPYGGSQAMFLIVLGLIREGVQAWTAQIQSEAQATRYGEAT